MEYNGNAIAAIARKLMSDCGLEVRDVARKVDLHRTVIYDIIRGDRVSKTSLLQFSEGLEANEDITHKMLVAAGYEQSTDPAEALKTFLNMQEGIPKEAIEHIPEEKLREIAKDVSKYLKKSGIIQ